MIENKQKIIVIIGPTASGKSDLAVSLALDILNGESEINNFVKQECIIISADSRQIYKYLDIGSGKITKNEMKGVIHLGLDIAATNQKFTAVDWLRYAEEKINEITNENKIPIICGGTGLYIDTLLYGVTDNPAPDYNFRREYENKTLTELQTEIKNVNLKFFNNLNNSEQNNKNRLIRKLEILKTNNNLNNINLEHKRELKHDVEFIILNPEKDILEQNIKARCEKRFESMLLETKDLLESSIDKNWLQKSGLEYDAIIKYFDYLNGDGGEIISKEKCKEYIITKSKQYAKRQISWNKRYENL